MCDRIASDAQPSAATIGVVPVFGKLAGWVIALVDIGMNASASSAAPAAGRVGVASPWKANSPSSRGPQNGQFTRIVGAVLSMQIGLGALAFFVNHGAAPEAVEAEFRRLEVWLVARQQVRKDKA